MLYDPAPKRVSRVEDSAARPPSWRWVRLGRTSAKRRLVSCMASSTLQADPTTLQPNTTSICGRECRTCSVRAGASSSQADSARGAEIGARKLKAPRGCKKSKARTETRRRGILHDGSCRRNGTVPSQGNIASLGAASIRPALIAGLPPMRRRAAHHSAACQPTN